MLKFREFLQEAEQLDESTVGHKITGLFDGRIDGAKLSSFMRSEVGYDTGVKDGRITLTGNVSMKYSNVTGLSQVMLVGTGASGSPTEKEANQTLSIIAKRFNVNVVALVDIE